MLVAVTISTISTTTTITAYATSEWVDSDEIKAKNDDGRQAIADADCGPVSGIVHRDVNQDCDALAANRDITEQEITDGEEEPPALTCEECFEKFLTLEQIEEVANRIPVGVGELCDVYLEGQVSEFTFGLLLVSIGVDEEEIDPLIECLKTAGVEII